METLYTCPLCETAGYTAFGLRGHRCRAFNRQPLPLHVLDQVFATGSLDNVVDGLIANSRPKKAPKRKAKSSITRRGSTITLRGPIANVVFNGLCAALDKEPKAGGRAS